MLHGCKEIGMLSYTDYGAVIKGGVAHASHPARVSATPAAAGGGAG